jgi:hypothetical protein
MKYRGRADSLIRIACLALTTIALVSCVTTPGEGIKEYTEADAATLTGIRSPYLHISGQERAFARIWLVDNQYRKPPIVSESVKVSPGHHDLGVLLWATKAQTFSSYVYAYSCVSLEAKPNASYSFTTLLQKDTPVLLLRVTEEIGTSKTDIQESPAETSPAANDLKDVVLIMDQCKK